MSEEKQDPRTTGTLIINPSSNPFFTGMVDPKRASRRPSKYEAELKEISERLCEDGQWLQFDCPEGIQLVSYYNSIRRLMDVRGLTAPRGMEYIMARSSDRNQLAVGVKTIY